MGSVAHAGSNLPTGGQVVGGAATIGQTSATQMQITSTTGRSAISWNDFSIGSGYGVNVTQPTGGTQLEQVRGTNVSQIFGSLTSNGSIVIANPNGIWFGASAQVDVAGLTATTAHATATDIQNFQNGGSLNLSQAGNANAAVVNQGNITISNAGLAAFVAPGVRNDGVIQARLGTVQLSSGTTATLDFYGDGLVSIAVTGQTLAQAIDPSTGKTLGAAVTNTGTLNADGGTVLVTANVASGVVDQVINTSGVIQARSVSQQNGQIVLDGGSNGTVQVAGSLDASGTSAGQTGGSVQVLGGTVNVASNTTIDASGDQGGGTISIGGGPHGQGTAYTASTVTVSQGATIKANAVTAGNGGTVAIWSAQFTSFDGSIEAMGGAQGGNGGFVETSGTKLTVGGDATVNTGGGTWLLDPNNITIATSGGDITPTTITGALSGGNVEIDTVDDPGTVGGTAGTIFVNSAVLYNSANSLSLLAQGDIDVNASIQNSNTAATGAINLVAGWDGSTGLTGGGAGAYTGTVTIGTIESTPFAFGRIGTGGITTGSVLIGSGSQGATVAVGSAGGATTVLGNNVTLSGSSASDSNVSQPGHDGTGAQIGFNVPAGVTADATGSITVDALGTVLLHTGSGNGAFVQIGHGGVYAASSVYNAPTQLTLTGGIVVNAASVTLVGGSGGNAYAQIGHGGQDFGYGDNELTSVSLGGDIAVTASGAVVLQTPNGGAYAQIGHGGAFAFFSAPLPAGFTTTGNITVGAASLALTAGSGSSYAQIGHGEDPSDGYTYPGGVTGNIDITVSGTLSATPGQNFLIGSHAGSTPATPLFIETEAFGGGLGLSNFTNTTDGEVVVAITAPAGYATAGFTTTGGGTFALLTTGELTVNGAISGSAPVDLIGGWNGTSGVPSAGGTFDLSTGTGALASGAFGNGSAGSNGISLGANVSSSGTGGVTLAGPTTLDANVTLADSAGGTIDFLSTLAGGNHDLTIIDDALPSFGGAVSAISGVTLAPYTTSDSIGVGDSGTGQALIGTVQYDFISTGGLFNLEGGAGTIAVGTGSNTGAIMLTQLTLTPSLALVNGGAGAITIGGVYDGTGSLALVAGSSITESGGSISVATLTGSAGGTVSLTAAANDIGTLGSFAVSSGSFTLGDNGNTGNLAVSGPVTAANITIDNTNTGTISVSSGMTATGATGTLALSSGSGGIRLNAGSALSGPTVDLSTTGSGVTQVASGTITAGTLLQGSAGVTGSVNLRGTANDIASVGSFAVSGGSFTLVDHASLTLDGAVSADNLFFEVNVAGGTLQIGSNSSGATLSATAASSPGVSLVADLITEGSAASTITATDGSNVGTVEIAPYTSSQTVSLEGTPASGTLVVDAILLGDIGTGTGGGTLRIGGYHADGGPLVTTAGNIALAGALDLTGRATTLDLDSSGTQSEGSFALTVATLTGSAGGTVSFTDASNDIGTLGTYAVSSGDFTLVDSGNISVSGGMTVTGSLTLSSGSGGIMLGGGTIQTGSGQTYSGAVTLGAAIVTLADTGGSAITFDGTVDSAAGQFYSLVTETTGVTTFSGAVGAGTNGALQKLTVFGQTALDGGSVNTSEGQVYGQTYANEAVTLGKDTTLSDSGGTVSFGGKLDGDFNLTVDEVGGSVAFNGAVGGATPLASLTIDGSPTAIHVNGGLVSSTGGQTYGGQITLGGNTTLDSSAGNGAISLGFVSGPGDTLTINSGTGGVTFGGFDFNILAFTVIGPETLDTGTYTVTGGTFANSSGIGLEGTLDFAQNTTFANAVTLDSDTSIVTTSGSATITFDGTVDGGHALTTNTTGMTTFSGAVGINRLVTQAATLDNNVTTAAGQTYSGGVTLGASVTLTDTAGGAIDFLSTLAGGNHNLTIVDDTAPFFGNTVSAISAVTLAPYTTSDSIGVGDSSFQGLIGTVKYDFINSGGLFKLEDGATTIAIGTSGDTGTITATLVTLTPTLTLTNGGTGAIAISGALGVGGFTAQSGSGGIALDANVTTGAGQTYSSAVTLGANTTLSDSGSGITFGNTVGGAFALDVTQGATTFDNAVTVASLTTQAVTFDLGSGSVSTTGSGGQDYQGAATLAANTTLADTGGSGVTFGNTVGGAHALDVTTGATTFSGAVTVGSINVQAVTFNLSSGSVATSAGQTYSDAVTLGSDTTLTDSGGSNVTFDSTVDSASGNNLALDVSNGAGTTTFSGAVGIGGTGTSTALSRLTVGQAALDGGTIQTTDGQIYGGTSPDRTITLGADATLTDVGTGAGNEILFGFDVGGGHNLTINEQKTVIFEAGVGNNTEAALASLTINGSAGGSIRFNGLGATTTAGQSYGSPVTLSFGTGTDTFTAGSSSTIVFGGTVSDGLFNPGLTIASGTVTFDGAVTVSALTTQTVTFDLSSGSVATTAGQTYSGDVTLGAAIVTLADTGGSAITFDGTVDSAASQFYSLVTETTGVTTFSSAVGAGTNGELQNLTVWGQTALDGGTVITSEGQIYGQTYANEAATLGKDTTLTDGGGSITFSQTLDGNYNLTIAETGGKVAFISGGVGTITPLASLTVAGGATEIDIEGGGVITQGSGGQVYGSPVVLKNFNATFDAGNGAYPIDFQSTVSDGVFTPSLTVATGTVTFGGAVTVSALTTQAVTFDLTSGSISTTGGQTYNGAATLAADTTLADTSGSGITFGSTIGGAFTLDVTHGGTTFDGAVNIGSLSVQAADLGADITTTGDQTYNGAITVGGDALLEATGSGATIAFNGALVPDYDSSGNLAVLANGVISVNAWIQNSGRGDISLVAGWDGVAPTSAADVSNLISGTHYGSTGGNVLIGSASDSAAAAVGSALGTTTVAGYDVVLRGGDSGGGGASAQIGYYPLAGGTVSGSIGVYATHDVTLQGGSVVDDYAQIGNGGDQALSNATVTGTISLGGSIDVSGRDGVSLAGGTGSDAYAQIGHGGFGFASGTSSTGAVTIDGDISVGSSAGNVDLSGGTGSGFAYAQIGHGGTYAFANSDLASAAIGGTSANITVSATAGSVELNSGTADFTYAQIGHGGHNAFSGATVTGSLGVSGTIAVTAANEVGLNGNSGYEADVQVGHGGYGFASSATLGGASLTGAISVTATGSGGDVAVLAGDNSFAYAQIGHGGGYAFIAIGGSTPSTPPDVTMSGTITVGADSVTLTGDPNGATFAYAQIGNGGGAALYNATAGDVKVGGDITVTADGVATVSTTVGDVILQAGSGDATYAQIGHGGASFASAYNFGGLFGTGASFNDVTLSGNVTVEAHNTLGTSGGVFLTGGSSSGSDAYAQIGHGGAYAFAGDSSSSNGGPADFNNLTLGGTGETITVAGDNGVGVSGGSSGYAYAQIGHGGYNFASGATVTNAVAIATAIAVTANSGDIDVTGGSFDAYAQIGHGGDYAFGGATAGSLAITGDISVTASDGSVKLSGSTTDGYAQIGDGGLAFADGAQIMGAATIDGDINVDATNTLGTSGGVTLTGDAGGGGYAQIGHGGSDAFDNATLGSLAIGETGAKITVTANGDIALHGGTARDAYVQIGHGGYAFGTGTSISSVPALEGNIDVSSTAGDISIQGGSSGYAFAQIGHGGGYVFGYGPATYTGTVTVNSGGTLSVTSNGNSSEFAVIGLGDPTNNGTLTGTVDVTSVGDQTYVNPNDQILAGGTYGTSDGTIDFWTTSSGPTPTAVTLSGSITIDNSTTVWGRIYLPNGNTTNMTFVLSGQDTTFTADVGNDDGAGHATLNRLGTLSVSGGGNFTIVTPAVVYVDNFTDSNMTGTVNFGATLDVLGVATLGDPFIGDLVCASGGTSCIVTINGFSFGLAPFDWQDQTLHVFDIQYALSNPGLDLLASSGINPQAGCSEEEKKANGGSCPAGGGSNDAVNYGNQFLNGHKL